MNYSLRIKKTAYKALAQINKHDRIKIINAIDDLKAHPHSGTLLKGQLSGLRRIRIGNFRVIYEVKERELIVLVIRIGHRKDIYR